MMLWFAGVVSAHLFWLLVLFGIMLWEARGGLHYKRPFVKTDNRNTSG